MIKFFIYDAMTQRGFKASDGIIKLYDSKDEAQAVADGLNAKAMMQRFSVKPSTQLKA